MERTRTTMQSPARLTLNLSDSFILRMPFICFVKNEQQFAETERVMLCCRTQTQIQLPVKGMKRRAAIMSEKSPLAKGSLSFTMRHSPNSGSTL